MSLVSALAQSERELSLERDVARARVIICQLLTACAEYVPAPVLDEWCFAMQQAFPHLTPVRRAEHAPRPSNIPNTPSADRERETRNPGSGAAAGDSRVFFVGSHGDADPSAPEQTRLTQ